MPRDYRVYLDDIIEAANKINSYTTKLDLAGFGRDSKTIDAVVRNLEIIGEAVKNLPADFRSKHPRVNWKKIAGLRDILVHEYFGIDNDIVWDIVQNELPVLLNQVKRILDG
ncbi:MAG: DUF86 domain-containing protein [Candidatus Omnitrophica bacterium]|nr:DUF86 domain-containing protein [Candidatus Omnitrophota bacterium]